MTNPRKHLSAARRPAPLLALSLGLTLLGAGSGAAEQPPLDPGGGNPAPCPDDAGQGCDTEPRAGLRGFYVSVGGGGDFLFNDDRYGLDEAGAVGAAVGYARGSLRFELELVGRGAGGGERHGPDGAVSISRGGFGRFPGRWAFGGEQAELEIGQVFVNFYYDFHNSSRFTPWIGAGGGWAATELEYAVGAGEWFAAIPDVPGRGGPGRSGFPRGGGFGGAEIEVSDTVPGVQLLAGLDIALGNRFSVETRLRWSHFGQARGDGAFDDGPIGWSYAGRSSEHGPFFGRGFRGAAPPLDLSSVGASLAFKYRF